MKKEWVLTQSRFDALLAWLDSDREQAGQKYEEIRSRLIKIFTCRGCDNAEELADETINRVIAKVEEVAPNYEGNPALYFYGVAQRVQLEYARRPQLFNAESSLNRYPKPDFQLVSTPNSTERDHRCLDRCLEELPAENRQLVLDYYQHEKQGKINHRKRLAEDLGIAVNALRIRAHRIRRALQKCVYHCLEEQTTN